MKPFLAALSTLTIFPLKNVIITEDDLRKAANYFPWVGLAIGLLAFLIIKPLCLYFPPPVLAILCLIYGEAVTKGFHLDGLADTADGFLSGRDAERKLEIMRDSRIGSMGVGAMVLLLLGKFACYTSVDADMLPWLIGLSMLCGRCGLVFHIIFSKYARKSGLGLLWFHQKPIAGAVSAMLLMGILSVYLWGLNGIAIPILLFLFAYYWSETTRKIIGGATGDTLGCCEEISELIPLFLYFLIR